MIHPFKERGREMARCTCSACGKTLDIPAMHGTGHGGRGKKTPATPLVSEGKVILAAQKLGWSFIGKTALCAECETARRGARPTKWLDAAKQATATRKGHSVTNVEPIRQPTREQKRQIIEMLTACYDTAAERYTGKETDLTIADAIGGGCMFGWVAAIREDMFGPAGGNEEQEALMADIAVWRSNADKLANDMQGRLRDFNDARAKVKGLEDRLAAVVKAVGPKVKVI